MLYFHCLTPGWPVGISEVVSPFETEEQWTSVYCCHCNFEILFSALAAKCLCSFQTKSSKSCLHFLLNAHMSPVIAKIPSINVILTFKWNFQNIVSFSSISDSFRNCKDAKHQRHFDFQVKLPKHRELFLNFRLFQKCERVRIKTRHFNTVQSRQALTKDPDP